MNSTSDPGTDHHSGQGNSPPNTFRYTIAIIVLILGVTFFLFVIGGGWNYVRSRLTDSRGTSQVPEHNTTVPQTPDRYEHLEPPEPASHPLRKGKQIYKDHCQACHGEHGAGDGPVSTGLSPKPRSFSSSYLNRVSDQYLFWRISEGKPQTAMPAFKQVLSRNQRWSVIQYVYHIAEGRQ